MLRRNAHVARAVDRGSRVLAHCRIEADCAVLAIVKRSNSFTIPGSEMLSSGESGHMSAKSRERAPVQVAGCRVRQVQGAVRRVWGAWCRARGAGYRVQQGAVVQGAAGSGVQGAGCGRV